MFQFLRRRMTKRYNNTKPKTKPFTLYKYINIYYIKYINIYYINYINIYYIKYINIYYIKYILY